MILVTVGITVRRVTSTLITMLLGFLMLLLELHISFGQISHLTGISATCLFPGLLRGIEGLSRLVFGATVLREPATLDGIVGCKGPVCCLAPLAILGRTAFLGGSFTGTSFTRALPGHMFTLLFGCCSLGLVGPGFLVVSLDEELPDILEV
jgi:hypothetical protein